MKRILAGCTTIILTLLATGAQNIANAEIKNKEVITSTAKIQSYFPTYGWLEGSGVLISESGFILTAAHNVVDKKTEVTSSHIDLCLIETEYSSPECNYSARVYAYDLENDIALIYLAYKIDKNRSEYGEKLTREEIEKMKLPHSRISDQTPRIGDDLKIFGFPKANIQNSITLTEGTVSGFKVENKELKKIATDATVNPGNSGSPTLNQEEEIVGIVTQVTQDGIGGNYGYLTPNNVINDWLSKIGREDFKKNQQKIAYKGADQCGTNSPWFAYYYCLMIEKVSQNERLLTLK